MRSARAVLVCAAAVAAMPAAEVHETMETSLIARPFTSMPPTTPPDPVWARTPGWPSMAW